jgi:hypothetical protein
MGLFTVKKGEMKKATAHVRGNNHRASGTVTVLYNDLHLTPLKADVSDSGDLDKKHLTSFIANTLLIKNDNPSDGDPTRTEIAKRERQGGDLFNLTWKTMLVGVLRTIGIPEKFAK